MNLLFLGTSPFAVPSLARLHEAGHRILSVVTRPDRPSGRGQRVRFSAVKQEALRRGLFVRQPARLDEPAVKAFRELGPEAIVVVAYGLILPPAVLQIPARGCINLHASLLPDYRGAAPVVHAILNGETRTGVTTMQMDEGLDTGPILLQRETGIGPDETAGEVESRLADLGSLLLVETLEQIARASLGPRPQDRAAGTYAPKIGPESARIAFAESAVRIAARVRAMNPRPGATTSLGPHRVKIWRAAVAGSTGEGPSRLPPGTVVAGPGDPGVICGDGAVLEIREIQFEGRRRVSGREAVRGRWFGPGDRFDGVTATPEPGPGSTPARL